MKRLSMIMKKLVETYSNYAQFTCLIEKYNPALVALFSTIKTQLTLTNRPIRAFKTIVWLPKTRQ